ncbi:MAG: type III pantothenate kinase [Aquificae bacterium]|nr:type III pantothenate kinase [Aquificota bacterium]
MELLTVDAGNTSVDLGFWSGRKLVRVEKVPLKELGRLPVIKLKGLGVCVRPSLMPLLKEKLPLLRWVEHGTVPLKVRYEPPRSLGLDRLVNAYGFLKLFGPSGAVVSAGTALVVDLVLNGVFEGGFITAGVRLKLEALSGRAELVPGLEPVEPPPVGRSTREAAGGGAVKESRLFVEGTVREWEKRFGLKLKVVVTGGDAALFKGLGVLEPYLTLKALRLLQDELVAEAEQRGL